VLHEPFEQAGGLVLLSISVWPSRCPSASARSERIVSTNSECAPLKEWMKPPEGSRVQRRAWTAPLTFNASS
jgi:hypothetical protein